ncbi:hypothetical protein ES703_51346 [subsurface metagenome]
MSEQLHFTTRVLGPLAVYRLGEHQVTQTIRGHSSNIIQAALSGKLKVGDRMQVTLDDKVIGLAEYVIMDAVTWEALGIRDARRGGFDTLDDLSEALRRAGYRFKPLNDYQIYRIQFSWQKED